MSGDDGLRGLDAFIDYEPAPGPAPDREWALLTCIPDAELAALRAQAAAADRVRELLRFWDVAETPAAVMETEIRRALDGDAKC